MSENENKELNVEAEAEPKKKGKKPLIIVGIVVGVLVLCVCGFLIWHEQPSFCNAICHTPMDPYYDTYNQEEGSEGTDKWGNTVSDASSMLCVTHKTEGITCLGCHVPTLSEQIAEGLTWIKGEYETVDNSTYGSVLVERSLADLVEARDIKEKEFCLNENCHNLKMSELVALTDDNEYNPHEMPHIDYACSDCHKAHRASVNLCTECHPESPLPDGWLNTSQALNLKETAE